jgi:sulfur transfer complex TusBCD TusB component (DsrH family)
MFKMAKMKKDNKLLSLKHEVMLPVKDGEFFMSIREQPIELRAITRDSI